MPDNMLESLSDEELVLLARDSVEAEAVLIIRYFRLVRFHAGRYATSMTSTDDLIQEGCIALLRAIRQFNSTKNAKFSSFAQTCMTNSMKSFLRCEKSIPVPIATENLLQKIQESDGFIDNHTPENIFIQKENYETCRTEVMAMLSNKEWDILKYILQGCSYAQTAEKLNISVKAVDNAMQRIRKKMRAVQHSEEKNF
ncbi:MAG: sigma-70 family RNA polymerase sigma factor [Oscillospiraceae bacterium]|nr:sigma-70 family RNA polymerase sigma factor [Oscillospiraceae bacterium]